jgi:type VI secretion system protein VasG
MRVDTKSLIKKLDPLSLKALEAAINLAVSQKMSEVGVEHWCYKIASEDSPFRKLLTKGGVQPDDFLKSITQEACYSRGTHQGVPSLSAGLTTLIHDAWMLASVDFASQEINSGHILIALVSSGFGLNALARALLKELSANQLKSELKALSESKGASVPMEESGALGRFTVDLLYLAKTGRLDRAVGRNRELTQVVDILCRRKQNNPILVGESGVGKTAIVEELAFCMLEGKVPAALKGASLRSLDFASLQAGASVQGEFESRVKDLLEALQKSTKVILFIDEIHNFLGSSGKAADAANLLKPALSKGLSVIGATTWAEYKKSFEKDAALTRRFQLVKVLEPSESAALDIMRKCSSVLEKHHKVAIEDSALESAVSLSVRYMNHARLPDKAIALLDSACTRIRLQHSMPPLFVRDLKEQIEINKLLLARLERELHVDAAKKETLVESIAALEAQHDVELNLWQRQVELIKELVESRKKGILELYFKQQKDLLELQTGNIALYESVNKAVIADILSEWTGIPISTKENLEELLSLDAKVRQRVIGQDHSIELILDTIRISKAKLANPKKPIGVFLLVGESGVGKTETALSLAEAVYGHESKIVTINMSEYKEGHKVASLIGSPPGYVGYGEGGRLTEAVRRNPYSVILLDEIEKAHPNVQDLFLQVFDKGTLTDSEGVEVDFKNTLIILTSNLGSKLIRDFCSKIREEEELEEEESSQQAQSAESSELHNKEAQTKAEEDVDQNEPFKSEQTLESQDEGGEVGAQIPKEDLEGKQIKEITPESMEVLSQMLQAELLKSLKPEFLGRLTVVPYMSLTKEILEGIIKLQLSKLAKLLKDNYGAELTCTNEALEKILAASKISPIGARQIEKIIAQEILPDLSIAILEVTSKGMTFGKVELSIKEGEFAIGIAK